MSEEERWRGRPKLALALKTLIVALPLAASVIVSLYAAHRLPQPEGTFEVAIWWLGLMAISAVVLVIGEAVARRFLPLVALLRLSLLFPGPAPSRIGVARASTRAELRRLSAAVERDGLGTDLATVARTLVILVGALDVHDRSTRGHSERVRIYTDLLAERLGLEEADRDRLRWAALLHDLGKLRIPVEVLNRRSHLSDADWELIHRHPEDGERMLGPLREWLGEWALVVRHHHERWDGGGYPDGIAGEEISLGARVVAIADSYDVMTSIRSYQPRARSAGVAREELVACAGTQFDPALVRRFLGLSTRRLWLILGPLSWLAQLPVVGPVLTEAAVVTTGQAVVVLGAASAAQGGFAEFADSRETRIDEEAAEDTVPATQPSTDATNATNVTDVTTDASSTVESAPASELVTTVDETTIPPETSAETTSTTALATELSTPQPGSTTSSTVAASSTTATGSTTTTSTAGTSSTSTSIATTSQQTSTTAVSSPQGSPLVVRPCVASTTTAEQGSAPEANPDAAVIDGGDSVVIDVLANDSDPDGDLDANSVALETPPRNGTVLLVAGGIEYTRAGAATGNDRFVYTVLDEVGGCDSAIVTIR